MRRDTHHQYFYKMLGVLLRISIIPAIFSALFASGANYYSFAKQMDRHTQTIAQDGMFRMEKKLESYQDTLLAVANSDLTMEMLQGTLDTDSFEKNLRFVGTAQGRHTSIGVVSADGENTIFTGAMYAQQNYRVYHDYGIYWKITSSPGQIAVMTTQGYGDIPSAITLGYMVNESPGGKTLGFVVLNIFEEEMTELFPEDLNGANQFVVTDETGVVVLDNTKQYEAGEKIDVGQEPNKWQISEDGAVEVLSVLQSDQFGLKLYTTSTMYGVKSMLLQAILLLGVIILLVAVVCYLIAWTWSRSLYRPVELMMQSMKELEKGDWETQIPMEEDWEDEMHLLADSYNNMVVKVKDLMQTAVEENERRRIAEFKALQSQISPHFFYNLLNDIKALAKLGEKDSLVKLVVEAGKLFRNAIHPKEDFCTLSDSIELVLSYLTVQNIRYAGKIEGIIDVPEDLQNMKMPCLILQPLVENSVVHGFKNDGHVLRVEIIAKRENRLIKIIIRDNGKGYDTNKAKQNEETGRLYNNMAMANIQKRLQLYYGQEAEMYVESEKDKYTQVTLIFPWAGNEESEQEM